MTNILVYDDTAEKLEEISDKNDMTVAEIIDALMDFIDEIQKGAHYDNVFGIT